MNTENTLKRAYAHWLKDGLFEIGLGILFTGVGALRAIIHFAGDKSAAYYWLTGGLLLFMVGCGWGFGKIGKLLKTRISYPRTGYTAFKPYPYKYRNMLVLLLFGMILGGMLGYLSTQPNEQWIESSIPIGQGIVGAIIFTYAAQRVKVKRLYFLAAFSIGIGLVIGALDASLVLGFSLFYLSIGLAMVVSGCVALMLFLRVHEPVDLYGESQ